MDGRTNILSGVDTETALTSSSRMRINGVVGLL